MTFLKDHYLWFYSQDNFPSVPLLYELTETLWIVTVKPCETFKIGQNIFLCLCTVYYNKLFVVVEKDI